MNVHYNQNRTNNEYEFVIIGFGASGIAAAIELKSANKKFKIIEKSKTYGGCWNFALPSSCLQTHRAYYKFTSVDYDQGTSQFPNKLEVLNYFRKAIDIHNLHQNVLFNSNAKWEYIKEQNLNWKILINNKYTIYSREILICTGTNYLPKIPRQFKTYFDDKNRSNLLNIIHSSSFHKYDLNKVKQIIIVGNGASACDILKFLVQNPNLNLSKIEVKVFYRNPKYFLPTAVKGIPGTIILGDPFLKFFEFVPKSVSNFLIILAYIFVLKSYLPIPNQKINSFNIIGSLIIQKMIAKGLLSYHKEEIEYVDVNNKLIKTSDAIYTDIDLIILATGFNLPNELDNTTLKLYKYVIPVKNDEIIKNKGYIGFNRTYNFIRNSELLTRRYIAIYDTDSNQHLSKEEVISWIKKVEKRKKENNLNFLDSTYELFELD